MVIIAGAVILLVLVIVTINIVGNRRNTDVKAEATAAPTPEQTVATENPTQQPTAEPTSEPVGDVADAARAAYRPEAKGNLLPVFKKANTDEKIIAITVDDCFQVENLRVIVETAIENDAKLTIFPLGKVAVKDSLAEVLRYAWENGMELENHTYSHSGLSDVSDERLAAEIYDQNLVLSKLLGVEYQVHFLRPRGGDAKNDERMHAYMKQMGYKGVAHWSVSGSGSSVQKLKDTLAPGNIYLFHTTDKKDFQKLCGFIPYAVSQGYKLVTLNEMFGYPENEMRPFSKPMEEYVAPTLAPYESVMIEMDEGTYDYRVLRLQQELINQGYLSGEADGAYGENTVKAVKKFQRDNGVDPTGVADIVTQEILYSKADAPEPTLAPLVESNKG